MGHAIEVKGLVAVAGNTFQLVDKDTFVIRITADPGTVALQSLKDPSGTSVRTSGANPYETDPVEFDAATMTGGWTATLADGATTRLTLESVTPSGKESGTSMEVGGEWDKVFARHALVATATTCAAGLVAGVLLVWSDLEPVWAYCLALVLVALVVAMAGVLLVALDVRAVKRVVTPADVNVRGAADGWGEQAKKALESYSKLRGSFAILVFAMVCVGGSAWVAKSAVDPSTPTTTTTTTTTTETTDTTETTAPTSSSAPTTAVATAGRTTTTTR